MPESAGAKLGVDADVDRDGPRISSATGMATWLCMMPARGRLASGWVRRMAMGIWFYEPIGLGDVTGDGRADLVLRVPWGAIWVRAGQSNATFFGSPIIARTGTDSSLLDGTGEEFVGVFDYSRDGRADLVAIDDEGDLLTYEAKPDGTFAGPVSQGRGT